jgi:hypothetical protein
MASPGTIIGSFDLGRWGERGYLESAFFCNT